MLRRLGMLAAAGTALALSGCIIVDSEVHESDGWRHADLERLIGSEIGRGRPEISIIAQSGGCTHREDFETKIQRRGGRAYEIGFRRIGVDRCKAFLPDGVRLTWSFDDLDIPNDATVVLMNPIGR